jgi:VWFA-related protein
MSPSGNPLRFLLVLASTALLVPVAPRAQQSPAPQDAPPQSFTVNAAPADDEEPVVTIHSTTRRVVVDVVVTGADGKPVSDLNARDFTVYEDRKPQDVRSFEIHTPEIDENPLPPAPVDLPSHTFVNLEQTPASGPSVVLLLDFLNSPLESQPYAHAQIVRFLEQKPASMQVAIFALGDQLSLLQGFTTDTSRLLAAMKTRAAGMHVAAASEQLMRAQITLDAFLDLGRFLSTMTGRKNLLWFSGAFDMLVLPKAEDAQHGTIINENSTGTPNPGPGPVVTDSNLLPSAIGEASSSGFSNGIGDMSVLRERMRKVAAALAMSQTAVYPIDIRGLMVDPGFSAAGGAGSVLTTAKGPAVSGLNNQSGVGAQANVQSHNDFMQSLNATHATMQEIAQATGGEAYVNSNGIALAAGKAVNDGASYYTLVYAPSNKAFDGGLRTIKVNVDKPGYHLAYRSAYYAMDPAELAPEEVQSGALSAAMLHGAPQAQALVFKAQIDAAGPPEPAAPDSPLATKAAYMGTKKSKKPQHLSGMVQPYRIRLAILAPQLGMSVTPDGRHRTTLEIAVYAYAADGQRLGGTKQEIEASMPPAVYERAMQVGMFHNLEATLPVEAASLRLAILDLANRHAGSLEIPLPLPPAQQAAAEPTASAPAAAKP